MNIYSPIQNNRWLTTANRWVTNRASLLNIVYPNGLVQSGVDLVEENFDYVSSGIALIAECDHMSRYTNTLPGGRTGSSQHQYLLYPHNPIGVCMVWCCGHVGWQDYRDVTEAFTVQRFLDVGWHVLVVPMPDFDYVVPPEAVQNILTGGVWTNNNGSWSNVGGTLVNYYEHNYGGLEDGGPDANRMFTDQIARATNQAIAEINPQHLLLAGHSGGGSSGNFAAAVDNRYKCWYSCVPGRPYNMNPGPSNPIDWEAYLVNPIYTNTPTAYDIWGMLGIAAAVPGRRSAVVNTTGDEFHPIDNIPLWLKDTQSIGDFIASTGASWTYRLEVGGTNDHSMNTPRLDWMINDIQTNVLE